MKELIAADLFCGGGGTSTGMEQAATTAGRRLELTAVNHWPTAVETHRRNHPHHRHVCASVDSISPRELFPAGRLDVLWASPECTHFSNARGGRPVADQRRAGAWCVVRWAEALAPEEIYVENVREFLTWGPLTRAGRPQQRRRGATFRAWVQALESLGYRVEHRLLCAADYGDPTSRERLFVRASRRGRIMWPTPTHGGDAARPWRGAREVIDFALPSASIYDRARPLAPKTMARIERGLRKFGGEAFVVAWDNQSTATGEWSADAPLTTITSKARHGLVQPFVIGQQSGSSPRSTEEPLPTVAAAGAIALVQPFLVSYYGTGGATPVHAPVPTVTAKQRFGLAQPSVTVDGQHYRLDVRFRMLQPRELAAAQGFPGDYDFAGTKADACRQIGNAVPCGLARALVGAGLTS